MDDKLELILSLTPLEGQLLRILINNMPDGGDPIKFLKDMATGFGQFAVAGNLNDDLTIHCKSLSDKLLRIRTVVEAHSTLNNEQCKHEWTYTNYGKSCKHCNLFVDD
jgi:hypothetical protein